MKLSQPLTFWPVIWLLFVFLAGSACEKLLAADSAEKQPAAPPGAAYAEIRVVDAETCRGVPLAELETVNGIRYVTDNAGRVAFAEPGLVGSEVFFYVRSHGYQLPKDGFGIEGVRITPQLGTPVEIKLPRKNIAQRLCRLTGEGLYRDSLLLGYERPLAASPHPGLVAGQDSIQTAIYREKVFCIWGDTQRMSYPLGLFRTAGATLPLTAATADPAHGFAYDYFVDEKTGFARAMMPLPERPEGVIWIFSIFVLPDDHGREKLLGHYSRRKGLGGELEQGIAVFDDAEAIFKPLVQLPLEETWRRPSGHPIRYQADGNEWLLFGSPNPNVRVKATWAAVLDPRQYEAFTCAQRGGIGKAARPMLDANGRPQWRWQNELPPVDSAIEHQWAKDGKFKADHARFLPADAQAATPSDVNNRVQLHRGTVRWNGFRGKWLLVAGQINGRASHLGEVWYAEADSPTGPFERAVKIVTHDRQTFYNVCQHEYLDRDGGRTIHFEGTYTSDFSGNPDKTPRYNYNQILYRLDLDAPALMAARAR